MGTSKGFVSGHQRVSRFLITYQANILVTNDTPPTACLSDFGFTTVALGSRNPMSSSVTLEGGTPTFMAPELLVPPKFGLNNAVPTQEGDVYAFGLVILQVSMLYYPHPPVFPDVSSGLDRRATTSRYQRHGTRVSHLVWRSTGEACKCGGYRYLRVPVGTHPKVLGWRQNAKTADP